MTGIEVIFFIGKSLEFVAFIPLFYGNDCASRYKSETCAVAGIREWQISLTIFLDC